MDATYEVTVTDKDGTMYHTYGSWTECLEFCEEMRENDAEIDIQIKSFHFAGLNQ